jgi:hypothetical protein
MNWCSGFRWVLTHSPTVDREGQPTRYRAVQKSFAALVTLLISGSKADWLQWFDTEMGIPPCDLGTVDLAQIGPQARHQVFTG